MGDPINKENLELGGKHIRYLDGVRGLAIIYVLLSHASNNGWHIIPGFDMAMSGKIGVYLFFILSSFLLSSQILTAYRRGDFGWKFVYAYFVARFFRIYPLYLSVLLLIVVFTNWFGLGELWAYVFLQKTSHHLWAIPVEFKFYFLLPLIFVVHAWLLKENLSLLLVLTAVFYVFFSGYGGSLAVADLMPKNLASPWRHMPVFILGFAGAVLYERRRLPSLPVVLFAVSIIVFVTPKLMFWFLEQVGFELGTKDRRSLVYGEGMELLLGIAWLVVVLGCAKIVSLRNLFSTSFLVFTGKISFSLYLLHYFLFHPLRGMDVPGWSKAWVLIGLSYAVAYASFIMIEKNGIAIGKYVSKKCGLR